MYANCNCFLISHYVFLSIYFSNMRWRPPEEGWKHHRQVHGNLAENRELSSPLHQHPLPVLRWICQTRSNHLRCKSKLNIPANVFSICRNDFETKTRIRRNPSPGYGQESPCCTNSSGLGEFWPAIYGQKENWLSQAQLFCQGLSLTTNLADGKEAMHLLHRILVQGVFQESRQWRFAPWPAWLQNVGVMSCHELWDARQIAPEHGVGTISSVVGHKQMHGNVLPQSRAINAQTNSELKCMCLRCAVPVLLCKLRQQIISCCFTLSRQHPATSSYQWDKLQICV